MDDDNQQYFINHPVFVKYKTRWDFRRLKRKKYLKTVAVNERIVEIPFALHWLSPFSPGAKMLDLGCTESILPLYLAGLGYQVTGCDFRPYPFTHPGLTFVRGDILQLPFAENYYDAALCISTIEHIGLGAYSDPLLTENADKRALEEIYRVLKKDGMLVLSVPYGREEPNPHQRVYDAGRLPRLLQNFHIEERRYFRRPQDDARIGRRSWEEIDKVQASGIPSSGMTNCVCLVKAYK